MIFYVLLAVTVACLGFSMLSKDDGSKIGFALAGIAASVLNIYGLTTGRW